MSSREDFEKLLKGPIYLAPNTFPHFYNGGKLRAEFVGEKEPKDDFRSEEWIFSTNRAITPGRENPPEKGLSKIKLPNGEIALLKDLLEAFPIETLGRKHYERFGATLGILVKIFDVGDGAHIPVHWHPSPGFSKKHLNSPYGKNEAWIVIGTRPGAKAWIGWKNDLTKDEFRRWMEAHDVEIMRRNMHQIEPKVGDVILLRDSTVHSIGSGLCILEPQEPTDWNILAEWEEYPYGEKDAALGLDWDTALGAVDFSVMPIDYLSTYVRRTPEVLRGGGGNIEEKLVPEEAKRFFWVTRLKVKDRINMPGDRGFYCMVTTKGEGNLRGEWGLSKIKRGVSVFIHASLPSFEVVNTGTRPLEIVSCYPPSTA